jgi:nucleotide-binding universal stress UspA family protein
MTPFSGTTSPTTGASYEPGRLFARIICGVDQTPESLEAVRQAERLRASDGKLMLAYAYDKALAARAGWAAPAVADQLQSDARAALEQAGEELIDAETALIPGRPAPTLLRLAHARRADLIALGTHGWSRAMGIALGTVGTTVLHEATCSVLFARPPISESIFPSSVLVGIDGSGESLVALEIARTIVRGNRVRLRVLLAHKGDVDADAARAAAPDLVVESASPVDALVTRAVDADLVIIGSRGLHGLRALGSVSEQVAHKAPCSVLVVRLASG